MDKVKLIPRGKLPIPVTSKASNSSLNKRKENHDPTRLNMRKHQLNRRSKSVTDLTSVRSVTFARPGFKPLSEKTQVSQGTKRIITKSGSTEEAPKPKQLKVKIPDWDYKARFNDLLQKHKKLQESLTAAQQDLTSLPEMKLQAADYKMNLTKKEAINKKYEQTINNQKEKIQILEENNNSLQVQLTSLEITHEQLTTDYNKLKTEMSKIKQELSSISGKYETVNEEKEIETKAKEQAEQENFNLQIALQDHEELRRQLHNTIQDLKGNIRVFCRVRPATITERTNNLHLLQFPDENSLEISTERESVSSLSKTNLKQVFHFDRVFPPQAGQEEVFEDISQLVQSALDGYHICIFAYGQTGSGKTHTMQGSSTQPGVIPRTVDLIFNKIKEMEVLNWSYNVSVSFLEIYNECVRDLLVPEQNYSCDVLFNDGSITVTNLQTVEIHSTENFQELFDIALENRVVAATDFNAHSSRSHAVTRITIEGFNKTSHVELKASLNLVDLAGSESAKTSSDERLTETKSINKSLSTLGNVMLALHNKESHVPYRNSKLTFLLQSCLGGNSKTLMFVNISPTDECHNESVNSIRFGTKVKEIKMRAKKNKTYHSVN